MNIVSRTGSLISFVMVILIITSILAFGPDVRQGAYTVIHGETIALTIADEKLERIRGLSGRDSLNVREGMLFIFDTEDFHGIWMNDMNFAIDIIWLENTEVPHILKVVDIEESVQPETFPEVFLPSKESRYVLELVSGASDFFALHVGDEIEIALEPEK